MSNRGWLSSLFSARSERRFELVVLEGAEAGRRFPLRYDRMRIGRRAADPNQPQEICLSDRSVSVRQANVEIKRGRVFIEHLPGATNPTVVNRRRVSRAKLRHGDIIVLGLVILELREMPEAGRAETKAASAKPSPARRALGDPGLEKCSPDAATPAAEAETWWDGTPRAEASEAATSTWSPPGAATSRPPEDRAETVIANATEPEPEVAAGPTAAGARADRTPEDEMPTIVRPSPESIAPECEDRAETITADAAEPEAGAAAGPTTAGLDADRIPEDEMPTIVRPSPESIAPACDEGAETIIADAAEPEAEGTTPEPRSQAETIIIESADRKPEP